jgi:phage terminase large subunit-like protein
MRRSDSEWWSAGFTKEWWLGLSERQRMAVLDEMDEDQVWSFTTDWRIWGRDAQLAPEGDENWDVWFICAGRGFGKSRTGTEQVRDWVERQGVGRICLLGQGEDDVREVMIEGVSGILNCSPPNWRPKFYPSVGCGHLIWPNGATGFVYSAADPEALRGPAFEKAWIDEALAFQPDARDKALSNLELGMREGESPQIIHTSTPKPDRWLQGMYAESLRDKSIRFTFGSTYDNADNLSSKFIKRIRKKYEGTSLGRQEVHAEILGDEEGALFTPANLDRYRIKPPEGVDHDEFALQKARECDKVVVGVDPNGEDSTSHAAGVVVAGRKGDRRFTLADRSTRGGPQKWAIAAVNAFVDFEADCIVAETNHGGEMVKMVIEMVAKEMGVDVTVKKVKASRGKKRRAEPIGTAYDQGRVSHVGLVGHKDDPGPFYLLEQQLCSIHQKVDPTGEDFDRADANNWAHFHLAKKTDDDDDDDSEGLGIETFGGDDQLGEAA